MEGFIKLFTLSVGSFRGVNGSELVRLGKPGSRIGVGLGMIGVTGEVGEHNSG